MENMTALDTDTLVDVGLVQPEGQTATPAEPTVTPTEPGAGTEPPATTPIEQPTTPQTVEYEIEGIGKVTPEQIKEWHNGNMRQSDYTKKTQELAKQRQEQQEALELFEYLKQNPHLVQQLQDADGRPVNREVINTVTPEHQVVQELYFNQMSMMIDKQLDDIKTKYGVSNINEAQLFDKARELGTNDLEFVYRALNFNTPTTQVDEKAIAERIRAEVLAELQQNKSATQTIVTSPSMPQSISVPTITDAELRVAEGMGLSKEDYIKWRDR